MSTRLGVNINDDTARALRKLGERHETSATEIIRRAVGVYEYVDDKVTDGEKLLIRGEQYETEIKLL